MRFSQLCGRYPGWYDEKTITIYVRHSTTTSGQSMMITTTLAAKFRKELNEVPFKAGSYLTEMEAEFIPVIDALHINPNEPLDPYS